MSSLTMEARFQDSSLLLLWLVLPLKHTLVNSKVLKRNNPHLPRATTLAGQLPAMAKDLTRLVEMQPIEITQLLTETELKAQMFGWRNGLTIALNTVSDIFFLTRPQASSSTIPLRLFLTLEVITLTTMKEEPATRRMWVRNTLWQIIQRSCRRKLLCCSIFDLIWILARSHWLRRRTRRRARS